MALPGSVLIPVILENVVYVDRPSTNTDSFRAAVVDRVALLYHGVCFPLFCIYLI